MQYLMQLAVKCPRIATFIAQLVREKEVRSGVEIQYEPDFPIQDI